MPWKSVKVGEKWKVVNTESGKVMGTHESKAKADRQVAALFANVPEARNK